MQADVRPGRRPAAERIVTCTGPGWGASIRQSSAALRWLRAALGPEASTAAIHLPSLPMAAWPTAYTPW